jgi:hypothetical protein
MNSKTLGGQITLIVAAMKSSFLFYIYAIFDGRLFRETLKAIISC